MSVVAGITITHPDRVIFPERGITKLDVTRYFARVAPLMLPHVVGRPLAVVRCPEGLRGECFFQKHWVGKLPSALDTVTIRQADGTRRPHLVVEDVAGLVTMAQWGIIEVHTWGARVKALDAPDRLTFDLDPGEGVPWSAVVAAATTVREALAAQGLRSWVKTTGGKGLHVVAPVTGKATWAVAGDFARAVAERIERAAPDRIVITASKAARPGKIFIDWLRNGRGATAVAPWSPRARPEAGVSIPLAWNRLSATRASDERSLETVLEGRLPADPWRAMLTSRQSLGAARSRTRREVHLTAPAGTPPHSSSTSTTT